MYSAVRMLGVKNIGSRMTILGRCRTISRGQHDARVYEEGNAQDPRAIEESRNVKANVPNVYNLGSSASELRCLASRSLNPSTYYQSAR